MSNKAPMRPVNSMILTTLFLLCLGWNSSAQKKVQYLQYEDLKPYHLGFLIGLHSQDLIIDHTGTPDEAGHRWYASVPAYTPGFSVGVIGDLRLLDYLSLRMTPSIHFGSKDVSLRSDETASIATTHSVRSNYITVPLSLRYRGARSGNHRPYLLGGISAGLDMGRDQHNPILLRPINTYLELGIGCDFYLPYFRLVPELKLSLGMGDVFVHNRSDQDKDVYRKYTQAIDRITSRLIVFSLQFE